MIRIYKIYKAYCIKDPKGKLLVNTINKIHPRNRNDYYFLHKGADVDWEYLKSEGYTCVRVEIKEDFKIELSHRQSKKHTG